MPTARAVFWIATLGALALVARTFWLGPLPLAVPVTAMLGYLALLTLGVILPRWEMFADVVEGAEPGRNMVALTFDDGPDEHSTRRVLETLDRYRAKATFFVIGRKAEQLPELMRAIIDAGHELGIHGYAHSRLTAFRSGAFIDTDLRRARSVLSPYVAGKVLWFRPPVGHVTLRIGQLAKKHELKIVCWTVRALDGLPGVNPDKVAKRVCRNLEDGGIVALHDAHERKHGTPAGVLALEEILEYIHSRGWRSVTLFELLQGAEPSATGSSMVNLAPSP
jgi:peptidoglycan-N-acetylglucosamine deacetylase